MCKNLQSSIVSFVITISIVLCGYCKSNAQTTHYVRQVATGNGTGVDWNNASADLQAMINTSVLGDRIFVATGTYKPNRRADATATITTNDRRNAFVLKAGVPVYGGFEPDNGITEITQHRRLPGKGAGGSSILSGDLGTTNDYDDNAYHVVVAAGSGNYVLDGFVIRYGNASAGGNITVNGQTVNNDTGGGIAMLNATATVTNCWIQASRGVYGGGVYTNKASSFYNCIVSGNFAPSRSGNGGNGAGLYLDNTISPGTLLVNCTLSGNRANNGNGGAVWNDNGLFVFRNSIVYYNSANGSQNGIRNSGGTVTVQNCLINDNSQITNQTNVTSGNPLFTTAVLSNDAPFTGGDYRLQSGSPVINKGNNTYRATGMDIAGNSRLQNSTIDLGAYESDGTYSLYVKENGTGWGYSWDDASGDLQEMINYAPNGQAVFVAKGTYKPNRRADATTVITPNDRDNAFVLRADIKIYGGFDPDNNIKTLDDNRIFPSSPTGGGSILSGDIGTANNSNDNTYHVVIASGAVGSAVLDGFTVTGGYANGTDNIVVNGRSVRRYIGGGMSIFQSSPLVVNCSFTANSSKSGGGGMSIVSSSLAVVVNCSITNNSSDGNAPGSGIEISTLIVGAVARPTIINTTIANNKTTFGFFSTGEVVLQNSIIWDGVSRPTGTLTRSYSLIKGSAVTANGNVSASGLAATDIFTDYAGGDYTLKDGSFAINAGNNDLFPTSLGGAAGSLDLAGSPRLVGAKIDLGAYECQSINIAPGANNILYVNINASGETVIGNSWANAIKELAEALKYARTKNNFTADNPLKIYVAKGTYKPQYSPIDGDNLKSDPVDLRDRAFLMVANVQLYGGFDPDNNIKTLDDVRVLPTTAGGLGSVLSGDVNGNDVVSGWGGTLSITGNDENNYHVVVASGDVEAATLDGFTITGGNANIASIDYKLINGNALYPDDGGGLAIIVSSSLTVNNCSFTGNAAISFGGGIRNYQSSFTVTNCSFSANLAKYGGGISNETASPTIINCAVTGNSASTGGGIYNSSPVATPKFTNVTIANNGSKGFYISSGKPVLQNSIVWETVTGTYTAQYSLIKGATATNNGNISAGGLAATDIFNDYANGDYTLKSGSTVINAGSNALYLGAVDGLSLSSLGELDLTGKQRLAGAAIDMGAYEYQDFISQTITFTALDVKTTNSADFVLTGSANSGLAVTYSSSNTTVAEVYQDGSVWKVKIKGEGITNITASQSGNANYFAAADVVQQLQVIGVPLPVTLISYTAKAEGNYVKLQWQTVNEVNNKGFVIERKNNERDFVKIGFVEAGINSNQKQNYSFTDQLPLIGDNYYRLKQIDNDGKFAYSEILYVKNDLSDNKVVVYPNPAQNKITLQGLVGNKDVIIANSQGIVVKTVSVMDVKNVSVDVSNFPAGIYHYSNGTNKGSFVKKD